MTRNNARLDQSDEPIRLCRRERVEAHADPAARGTPACPVHALRKHTLTFHEISRWEEMFS